MNTAKKKYQKQCKIKTVTFYTNKEDQELYEFANTMNFQKFVKDNLKQEMENCKLCIIEEAFGSLENYENFKKELKNGNIQDN